MHLDCTSVTGCTVKVIDRWPCSGGKETIRVLTDGCINVTTSLGCKHGTGRQFKMKAGSGEDVDAFGDRSYDDNVRVCSVGSS